MMRTNAILGGLALAQLAVAAGAWAWTASDTPVESRALVDLEVAAIDRIDVQDDVEAVDVTLERDGDGWRIVSAGSVPAKADAVDELLGNLLDVEVRHPVATTATSHASLGLTDDDFARRITLTAGDRTVVVTLGSGRDAHVRVDDDPTVWKAEGLSAWSVDTRAFDYVDKDMVDVTVSDVDSLQIGDALAFVRQADGDGWELDPPVEGRVADSTAVQKLVDGLGELRLANLAEDPATTVDGVRVGWTVTQEGQSVPGGFVIGAEQDGQRLFRADGMAFAGRISTAQAEPWLEASLESLTTEADGEAE